MADERDPKDKIGTESEFRRIGEMRDDEYAYSEDAPAYPQDEPAEPSAPESDDEPREDEE